MKTAESVKAHIKHKAKINNRDVQDLYILYVLERVLYRLSISPYKDMFVLKGGCLLYGIFNGQFTRTTTDIDLLGFRITNDADYMRTVFVSILNIECDDAIRFDISTVNARNITEFKEYHGVNISALAYLDLTRIPVNIDVGYNDVIYPGKWKMEYPTILDDEHPIINAYSLESIIAEKFEAIVSLGLINSRYKDFYDIYALAHRFDFYGEYLRLAVTETFEHRKSSMERITAFENGFTDDLSHRSRWKGFIKSRRANAAITFKETVSFIKAFLEPIIMAINNNEHFEKVWDHNSAEWETSSFEKSN